METIDKTLYNNVFVFIEQREQVIQPVALELLGKAKELAETLNEKVVALFPGHDISSQAQLLIEYGADEVICMDAPELEEYITEPYTQAVYQAIKKYKPSIVLFGATTIGRDLAPRLSARLATGLTADCTKLEISEEKELLMTRPAFGGNLMATIICDSHRPQMSTVRPGVMQKMEKDITRQGKTISLKVNFDTSKFKVRLIEKVKIDKMKKDITEAKILVSGGRGVGSREGFERLSALAELLQAEVSASRAVIDAGWLAHGCQVGQTGKTVRPDLYIAAGISGAIQHVAGMEESDFVIAINKDKSAPIFSIADVGIVGDVNKIIPLLTERLAQELDDDNHSEQVDR